MSNQDKANTQGLDYAAFLKGDLCLLLFYVCVSVEISHVWGPLQRPEEEGVRSPRAGVTGGGVVGAVNQTQVLWKSRELS